MDQNLETTEGEYTNSEFAKDIAKAIAVAAAPYVTFVAGRFVYRKVQEFKAKKAAETQTEEN